tara:strand:+ start:270 stop:1988 length:1719 start_codon:yes stop_codon:yes gene_type:complete
MKVSEYNEMMAYLLRPRQKFADGGRIKLDAGGDAFRLKQLEADYAKFGKSKLDEAAKVLGFKDYADMGGEANANFRRKIKNELIRYGEVLPRYEADVRGRKTRIPKEQNIQIKLLEETNKKKFFDPKKFAKENKISMDTLKKQSSLLQKNIYNKRMLVAGKKTRYKLDWIPDNPTFSDNTLNKLWKSKLIKYDKNKIDEIFYQAFGNKKSPTFNPKKFLAIRKNLNEYRQLRDAINAKYPNINFELDHPLSKSSLNKLFNATTDQLTRVNVLEADLNNGFKDSLSLQYEKAVQGKNLTKKKAVEKIARDLKLNIGKISDDATNFKYGVKEFQKLNIKNEIRNSLLNLENLNKNFQTYAEKNPELFKTAGVSTQQTFTKVQPSKMRELKKFLDIEGKKLNLVPASKLAVPEKTKTRDMFKDANTRLGANPFFDPKNILTGLGDVARVLSTPSVSAIFAGTKTKENLEKGESLPEALADVEVGTSLLYPELAKRTIGQLAPRGAGILSTIGRVAANPFFRAARAFTPVGAGLTAIGLAKDAYERYQELEAMSPEQREDLARERDEFSFGEFGGA